MASLYVLLPQLGTGLANHLWQSTLFLILATALTMFFRKNRAVVRYRLWLAASIKFLVPFSLLIGIGGQLGWRSVAPQFTPTAVPVIIRQVSQPFLASSSPASSSQPAHSFSPAAKSPMALVIIVVWITGIGIISTTWWRRWTRVAQLVRRAEAFETPDNGDSILAMSGRVPVLTSSENMEPGVFGIFRPVLLLPASVARTLSGKQLESILCHEMSHVRGRDNVASALHTIVQALFWFHPLVWWLGNRLVVERERACDEAVLQLGFEPADYAEGILKVCKSYLTAPACMAGISGINLKNRIEAIMENRTAPRLSISKKLLLGIVATGTIAVPILTGFINAAEIPPAPLRAISTIVTPASSISHQQQEATTTRPESALPQHIVLQHMDQTRKQYNFPSEEALASAMAAQGTSTEDVKESILRKPFEVAFFTQAPVDDNSKNVEKGKNTIGLGGGVSAACGPTRSAG